MMTGISGFDFLCSRLGAVSVFFSPLSETLKTRPRASCTFHLKDAFLTRHHDCPRQSAYCIAYLPATRPPDLTLPRSGISRFLFFQVI